MKSVSKDDLVEYAMLANKCYSPYDDNCCLPQNWTALEYCGNNSSDGNVYGLFINESKKEIVFGIKGTDNFINLLSDGKVVLRLPPIGQEEAERRARQVLEKYNPNQREAVKGFISSVKLIDNELSSVLLKINYMDLYILLKEQGFLGSVLAYLLNRLSHLLPGQTYDISDLRTTNVRVRNHLITSLNNNTMQSVMAFGNAMDILMQMFGGYTFRIVGHSLGAVMAELCAVEVGVECIGFESPGTQEIIQNITRYKSKNNFLIMTYLSAPNIINTLHSHSKHSYRMFLPHTDKSISFVHVANCICHGVSRVLTYLSFGTFTLGKLLFQKVAVDIVAVTAGAAVGAKLAGGVFGLFNDREWLMKQHGLKNIIAYLKDKEHVQIKPIVEWPKLHIVVTEATVDLLKSCFIPLRKDLPGFRNIFDEEGMRESNITKMVGYKVDEYSNTQFNL